MIFLLNHQSNQQVKFEGIKIIISWITRFKIYIFYRRMNKPPHICSFNICSVSENPYIIFIACTSNRYKVPQCDDFCFKINFAHFMQANSQVCNICRCQTIQKIENRKCLWRDMFLLTVDNWKVNKMKF